MEAPLPKGSNWHLANWQLTYGNWLQHALARALQIQAQHGAGHVGLCHLHEVLLTPSHVVLVLEYEPGEEGSYLRLECPHLPDTLWSSKRFDALNAPLGPRR